MNPNDMNPNDMNPNDPLHTLMRGDYIDDDGFTEAVASRLPPPRRTSRWRTPILLTSAGLGCILSFGVMSGGSVLVRAFADVMQLSPSAPAVSWVVVGTLALSSMAVAWQRT